MESAEIERVRMKTVGDFASPRLTNLHGFALSLFTPQPSWQSR